MPYTYYHREQGRDIVVISEYKVPENIAELSGNIEAYFEGPFKNWLSCSKSYDVYPEDEIKFYEYFSNGSGLFTLGNKEYFLIPNEVVSLLWVSPDGLHVRTSNPETGWRQYAFFNQPEEKKTEIVEMTDNYVRARSNFVPEWALKLGDLHKELIAKLDSSVQPEEKDLWPSDYYEKLKIDYKLWKESKIHSGAFSATVHNFILDFEKLKQKYNLIPKSRYEKPSI